MYNQFPQFSQPFMPQQAQPFQSWSQNLQRQEIIKVNGENGARAYQMAPQSSAILMDESHPLIWVVQTDGAGYKTVTPFTITPYQAQPAPDLNSMNDRITRLEEILNGRKPDSGSVKRTKPSTGDAGE